jgi:hypothetical protein
LKVGALPDRLRGALIEEVVNPEIPFQLQVRTVIERIAQQERNGTSPGEEFFIRLGVTGHMRFGNSVGAHDSPFVVVAFETSLKQILEAAVLRDIGRRKVRVVIQNGLLRSVAVIKLLRRLAMQQEVIVDEIHDLSGSL